MVKERENVSGIEKVRAPRKYTEKSNVGKEGRTQQREKEKKK